LNNIFGPLSDNLSPFEQWIGTIKKKTNSQEKEAELKMLLTVLDLDEARKKALFDSFPGELQFGLRQYYSSTHSEQEIMKADLRRYISGR
jgi:hypothetical protein